MERQFCAILFLVPHLNMKVIIREHALSSSNQLSKQVELSEARQSLLGAIGKFLYSHPNME